MSYIIVRNDTNQILTKDCFWENRETSKNQRLFKDSITVSKIRSSLKYIGNFKNDLLTIEHAFYTKLFKIDVEEFLDVIKSVWNNYDNENETEKSRIVLNEHFDCNSNETINGHSTRYLTFIKKGTTCSQCGLQGIYFWIEKANFRGGQDQFHANLYGVDPEGFEVQLTKDHIFPKSLGGKSNIKNYQTLCEKCNKEKSNKVEN